MRLRRSVSAILGIIIFVAIIAGIFFVKNTFMQDESKAIYGSRLDGIENVKITNETKDKVKELLKEDTSSVSIRLAGRTINIIANVNEGTDLNRAKELGKIALEAFSEDEKKYYDIQIFIENKKNTAQFPIIGYKNHTKENISWSKDRKEAES